MKNPLEGLFKKVERGVGLASPTPESFAKEIRERAVGISESIANLRGSSPDIKLSEIDMKWADQGRGSHSLTGLAEMGNPDARKIIDPRHYILEEMKEIKKKIEKLRRMMEKDENARRIVGAWDTLELEQNSGEKSLSGLPQFLADFVTRLESR